MPQSITLVRPISEAEAAQASSTGRFKALIINAGWGSSGYYGAPVLEAAGTAQVFPAGTQMYLDHPSYSERSDRPERSVKDLAGVLTEAGTWDAAQQGLVAEVQVFGPYREVLAEMADVIGLSIRASAQVETGEAEGRTGTIVTELVESESVDFVTRAGRGGRILSVLESARPSLVVERAVAHGVVEATANDTREALQGALRDRFAGEQTWLWVRDFDETNVWYELETPDSSGCWQLTYQLGDDLQAVVDGDPIEVTVRTQYVPVDPAGQPNQNTTESQGGTMPKIEVDEAEYRTVTEAAGRVQALESERDAARKQLAESKARDKARPVAVAVVGESKIDLPQTTRARLVESAVASLRVGDDGAFDEAAFKTAVESARTDAEAEVAEALQAAGHGRVTDAGHTTTDPAEVAEARKRADAARARAFGRTSQEG